MIEATLSVRIPELWVTAVTEKHDVAVTCRAGGSSLHGGWGFVTLQGADSSLDGVVADIRKHPSVGEVKVTDRSEGAVALTVEVVRCRACEVLMRSRSLLVFPVEVNRGRMTWVIVTDMRETLKSVVKSLNDLGCDATLERLTSMRGSEVLTERQEEVVRKAFSAGYFDYPRKIGTEALAKRIGISMSTLSEVLRAAQRRILGRHLRM